MRQIDTNSMITTPYYMRHIFEKICSFLKNVSNVLHSEKGRLHLEEALNLNEIVG